MPRFIDQLTQQIPRAMRTLYRSSTVVGANELLSLESIDLLRTLIALLFRRAKSRKVVFRRVRLW